MGTISVNVRETNSLEGFRPILNTNMEMKTKHIYVKEKRIRPGAGLKLSSSEGSPTMLRAKSLSFFLKGLQTLPLKF